MRSTLLVLVVLVMAFVSPNAEAKPKRPTTSTQTAGDAARPVRGPTHYTFENLAISGQSNRAGAVCLQARQELKLRSMIQKPDNFRDEILGSIPSP